MSTLTYTDPELVTDHRVTDTPRHNSASGYGPKIPTRHMVKYAGRWHRVYVMVYGNGGSAYILKAGTVHHLDTDTEHNLTGA